MKVKRLLKKDIHQDLKANKILRQKIKMNKMIQAYF